MGRNLFRSNKGASMVELAIFLPLVLILLFAIIEFSVALYDKAVLTNASREGARAGIVARNPRVDDATIRSTVRNYCQNYLITFGNYVLSDASIIIVPANRNGLPFGTDLRVTVNYQYDFLVLSRLINSIAGPITLSATTVMKLE